MAAVNKSHGEGTFERSDFRSCPESVILEAGVLVFHPENIALANNVYIGHQTILKAYYRNDFIVGENTWIGQQCFLHSAGGIFIGANVGIGPGVKILTSSHRKGKHDRPILEEPVDFAPVVIEEGADIGIGAIILPGVTIGRNCQVGAGAVVTKSLPPFSIAAGVPARSIH